MAKSDKHKKLRKKEKAKIQLKGGLKTLGKAQNVIEPKLQTKKIVLREQLKSPADSGVVVTSRRKQSLADVLSSLAHHNTNVKVEALTGLYELITTGNNVLESNLGRIVDKVGLMTSDMEGAVRRENLKVAEALLCQVSEAQLQPFWNLLLTHLKCTLTDLNPAVRQSCLSFISQLVTSCPNLVFSSRSTILPAVLNLISNTSVAMNSSSSAAASSSNTTTRLKLGIEDKSSEIKERIRVLSLIASCLDLKSASPATAAADKDQPIKRVDSRTIPTNTAAIYVKLRYPFGYENENHRNSEQLTSLFSSEYEPLANSNQQNQSNGSQFMNDFTSACFPVLCETWIEVAPSLKLLKSANNRKSKNRQQEVMEDMTSISHLNKSAVDVLQCVVNVMFQIIHRPLMQVGDGRFCNMTDKEDSNTGDVITVERPQGTKCELVDYGIGEKLLKDLRKKFGQDLQKVFFNFLPFSCSQENQRQNLMKINLMLFNLAAEFRLFDQKLLDKFEKYVNGMINRGQIAGSLVTMVLETVSLVDTQRVGKLTTKFIEFANESGCEAQVCEFLLKILTPSARVRLSAFVNGVDWYQIAISLLATLASDQPTPCRDLVDVLRLIALRNLVDLRPVLPEYRDTITRKFIDSKIGSTNSVMSFFHYVDDYQGAA